MRNKTYELGQVIVELTRRCNMKCEHCMRGPAQCRDMSDAVMDAMVKKMSGFYVGSVTLGGGESTLVPKRVSRLEETMRSAGIYPGSFIVMTNGKAVSDAFIKTVVNMQGYTEVSINASLDSCHEFLGEDHMYDLDSRLRDATAGADRFHEVRLDYRYGRGGYNYDGEPVKWKHDRNSVLRMGRGATEFGGYKAVTVYPYDVKGDGEDYMPLCEDDFYVDVNGDVWPHCDLSYRFMSRRRRYCLGNVTDPGFDWFRAAVKFNLKFAKEFPLKLMEPEHDNFCCSNSEDYQSSSTREKIAETVEIAKQLNLK